MTNFIFSTILPAADAVLAPVFEGGPFEPAIKALDKELDGALAALVFAKDFEGKRNQVSLVYTAGKAVGKANGKTKSNGRAKPVRVFLLGLGPKKELNIRRFKQTLGTGLIAAQGKKADSVAVILPEATVAKFNAQRVAAESVVALSVAAYSYDDYKKADAKAHEVKQITLVGADNRQKGTMEKGISEGETIARAINWIRHLSNTPPTVMTPTYLAAAALKLAKESPKVKVKVLSRAEMKKLGMGCLLGVARGSAEEPKFIIAEYRGGGAKDKPTALVGKGITFDSGGLSLKPSFYMSDMKFDMLGAATVLGVVKAAAGLKLKKNIVALAPSCENMPDGGAYRPDDILTAMDGTTVHVSNTDAEGRLILADALVYTSAYKPKEVIDFATLTGHCRVALGMERSGLFSDQENMVRRLEASSEAVGEQLWRMPLGEEFTEGIKSEVADIDNSGSVGEPRSGGASLGAAFLEHFAKYPWAHIDMSCCYYTPKGKPWIRAGANGFGLETMVEYLRY